ncbi:MAG: hypothetical protein ACKO7W_11465 [Elainella sp.]
MSDLQKLISELYLQQQQLLAEVAAIKSLVAGTQTQIEGWATPDRAAAALLPDGVENARHLQRLRLDGVFSEAKGEVCNLSKGKKRPTWRYHVPKCRTALQRHFKRLAG